MLTPKELEHLKKLARINNKLLTSSAPLIKPGQKGSTIAHYIEQNLKKQLPRGRIFSLDININQQVCHCPPTDTALKEGDILTIDLVIQESGLHADGAWTFLCGKSSAEDRALLNTAWETSKIALAAAIPGCTSLPMKKDIHNFLRTKEFTLIPNACGHGIGHEVHAPPDIHYSLLHPRDIDWKEGMTFTVEPILSRKNARLQETAPGIYTTHNQEKTAYFEHMACITAKGPVCLNLPRLFDYPQPPGTP